MVANSAAAARHDEPEEPVLVVVRVLGGSSLEALGQQLCVHLNQFAGLAAMLCATTDDTGGGRTWLRETMSLVSRAAVFVPLIDEKWFAAEDGLLELALAMRRSLHTREQPILLPILSGDLVRLEAEWAKPDSAIGDVGPVLEAAMAMLPSVREAAFHLVSGPPAKDMAIKVVNFMRQLDFPVSVDGSRASVATGASIASAYQAALGPDRKPNSGLVKAFAAQVDNSIRNDGPSTCERLLLPRLFIADVGTIALARVLRMMPCLTTLDLSGNGVNNKGVAALCAALQYHPSVASINLSNNLFSVPAAAELLMLLRENRRIVELDVSDNFIQSAVWEKRLANELEANRTKSSRLTRLASAARTPAPGSGGCAEPPHLLASSYVEAQPSGDVAVVSPQPEHPTLSIWKITLKLLSAEEMAVDVKVELPPTVAAAAADDAEAPQQLESSNRSSGVRFADGRHPGESAATALPPPPPPPTPGQRVFTTQTTVRATEAEQQRHVGQGGAKNNASVSGSSASLIASMRAYLGGFVALHSLTFTRVNGKALRYVLEGSERGGIEGMVTLELLPWLQRNTDAAAHIGAAIAQGQQRMLIRVEQATGDAAVDFFTELELGLWQLNARVYKSLAQVFRASDITRYSGNIADEVAALVSMITAAGDVTAPAGIEPASSPDGASADPAGRVAAAESATAQSFDRMNNAQANTVLSSWGRQ